jgi:hypothetical protein
MHGQDAFTRGARVSLLEHTPETNRPKKTSFAPWRSNRYLSRQRDAEALHAGESEDGRVAGRGDQVLD